MTRRPTAARWPLSRITGISVLAVAAFSIIAAVLVGLALANLSHARGQVLNQADPAVQQALRLDAALLDQETGVRGYALAGQPDFLAPYTTGVATEQDAVRRLQNLMPTPADLTLVTTRANTWRTNYAEPIINRVRATNTPTPDTNSALGKADFDSVRSAIAALQRDLAQARTQATTALSDAASTLDTVAISLGAVLVAIVVILAIGLRLAAIRPLTRLTAEVRQVVGGDFDHEVATTGPKEIRELGDHVNNMRERILQELSTVRAAHAAMDARTQDLQRSNAELEQFAYVASHDLQEPLRKVASFCQLLQRRYGGRLDERADQYIGFAVDGAKRMQILINDLLAFSRVGRAMTDRQALSANVLVDQARANLAESIEWTRATIEVGDLPTVLAEVPLLTAVFQNLIGNALKFRGDDPPQISISARREGQFWLFTVADRGIGIPVEYAERIFVIFQRLHGKNAYPGTGIGLAMCRKIIEYHGGRIWLDATAEVGSRFLFTLPLLPTEENDDD